MSLETPEFVPTREAGLARLAQVLPRLGRWYAGHGGIDHGPSERGNTAALSPWLTCRLVTPEEALAAVQAEHGAAASAAFREEVHAPQRRRAWLADRPTLWRAHRARVEALFRAMGKSPTLLAAYDEAVEGRTGIDAFDSWVRELGAIGWLHPTTVRAVASLWIFSLRLPWELGADLHYRLALDGDAADLVLWREVAGLQPGRPHAAITADAIAELSARRFQPKRRLIEEQAPPLPRDAVPGPSPQAAPPALDTALRTGRLISEADIGAPAGDGPTAALGTAPLRSPFGAGERLSAWLDGALAAGGERLDDADWPRSLAGWARTHDLQQVATTVPPPGLLADRLAAAALRLEKAGVRLAFT